MADPDAAGKFRGAGDLARCLAGPVAKLIDAALGTDIEHCETCADRQRRLNELLPFPPPPAAAEPPSGRCFECARK